MKGYNAVQEAHMLEAGYLSVSAVARAAHVSPMAVRGWVNRGRVKAVRVGRRVYVSRVSVAEYLGPDAKRLGLAE